MHRDCAPIKSTTVALASSLALPAWLARGFFFFFVSSSASAHVVYFPTHRKPQASALSSFPCSFIAFNHGQDWPLTDCCAKETLTIRALKWAFHVLCQKQQRNPHDGWVILPTSLQNTSLMTANKYEKEWMTWWEEFLLIRSTLEVVIFCLALVYALHGQIQVP